MEVGSSFHLRSEILIDTGTNNSQAHLRLAVFF